MTCRPHRGIQPKNRPIAPTASIIPPMTGAVSESRMTIPAMNRTIAATIEKQGLKAVWLDG